MLLCSLLFLTQRCFLQIPSLRLLQEVENQDYNQWSEHGHALKQQRECREYKSGAFKAKPDVTKAKGFLLLTADLK